MTGDPADSVPWLTEPYRRFGERLGTVLLRVPDGSTARRRPAGGGAGGLAARPAADDGVPGSELARGRDVRGAGRRPARPCARPSCRSDADPPTIRRTGPFLYLRLRRHDYTTREIDAWAIAPRTVPRRRRRRVRVLPPRRGGSRSGTGAALADGGRRRARAALTDQPREPSAGPKTTSSTSRSVMSWKRVRARGRPRRRSSPGPRRGSRHRP